MDHFGVGRACGPGGMGGCCKSPRRRSGGSPDHPRVAIVDPEGRARIAGDNLRSPHSPATRGSGAGCARHNRGRGSLDGALVGDGPRPIDRVVNEGGAKSLVERLNQTVSIHPEMAAPTHLHKGDIHDSRWRNG